MTSSTATSPPNKVKGIVWPLWTVVAIMAAASIAMFRYLPDPMPTHWGFSGEPDAWGSKWNVFLIPGMAALLTILFSVFERIDPKRINYRSFQKAWLAIRFIIIAFLAYIQAITMFVSIRPEYNGRVGDFVTAGVGVLFIVMGNYMGKIRQNWFVGMRTPWTLEDPEVWQKSQRLGGWAFVIAGIVVLVMALTVGTNPWVFFPVIFIAAFTPAIYSYVIHRKKHS
jgi:uncharacterized membrane protein